MLDFWEGEARADGVTEEVIQAVAARLRSYEKLSPEGRAESLKGLWKRIGETYPEAGQKPKSGSQPSHPPRAEQPSAQSVDLPSTTVPQERQPQKPRPAPAPRSEAVPGAKTSQTPAALNATLTVLQGVGPRHAETLAQLGMKTLGDMLYYFPRRYEDYSKLKPIKSLSYGEVVTALGVIQSARSRPIKGGKQTVVEVIISDTTGALRLSYFKIGRAHV